MHLQPVTPGTTDIGNFNINGAGITGYLWTNDHVGSTSPNMLFGSNANAALKGTANRVPTSFGGSDNIVIGRNVSIGSAAENVLATLNCIAIGTSSFANRLFAVAIGGAASAGNNAAGAFDLGSIALGYGATARQTGAGDTCGAIAAGLSAQAIGPATITIGGNSAGSNALSGNVPGVITIGHKLTNTNRTNAVYIDTLPGGINTLDNALVLGNAGMTKCILAGVNVTALLLASAQTVNDADFVASSSKNAALYSAISAARVVTLPAANAVPAGWIFRTVDFSGSASAVNTITTNPAGADTIVGAGTSIIATAYGSKRFMSDGVSKWSLENNW
jgi:hypothetical protein